MLIYVSSFVPDYFFRNHFMPVTQSKIQIKCNGHIMKDSFGCYAAKTVSLKNGLIGRRVNLSFDGRVAYSAVVRTTDVDRTAQHDSNFITKYVNSDCGLQA